MKHVELIDSFAEITVIGGCLISPDLMPAVQDVITPEDFGDKARGYVFAAMCRCADKNPEITFTDVVAEITMMNAGEEGKSWNYPVPEPVQYLSDVLSKTPDSTGVISSARHISDATARQAIYAASLDIANLAIHGRQYTLEKLVEEAEVKLYRASMQITPDQGTGLRTIDVFTEQSAQRLARIREGRLLDYFIPSGLRAIDQYIIGYELAALTFIAARPGEGKTSLAISCALAAAKAGKRVAFFSLEMPGQQLVDRMICSESGIDFMRLRKGELNDDEMSLYDETKDYLDSLPILIDDSSSVTPMALRRRCRRSFYMDRAEIIFIDYFQLMESDGGSPNEAVRVDNVARTLKIIARELKIPIVALGQLSRAVENRQDPRPVLSDLRYGGEQHADCVIVLSLGQKKNSAAPVIDDPERYKPCIRVVKNRNGPTGDAVVQWLAPVAKYIDVVPEGDSSAQESNAVILLGEPATEPRDIPW